MRGWSCAGTGPARGNDSVRQWTGVTSRASKWIGHRSGNQNRAQILHFWSEESWRCAGVSCSLSHPAIILCFSSLCACFPFFEFFGVCSLISSDVCATCSRLQASLGVSCSGTSTLSFSTLSCSTLSFSCFCLRVS